MKNLIFKKCDFSANAIERDWYTPKLVQYLLDNGYTVETILSGSSSAMNGQNDSTFNLYDEFNELEGKVISTFQALFNESSTQGKEKKLIFPDGQEVVLEWDIANGNIGTFNLQTPYIFGYKDTLILETAGQSTGMKASRVSKSTLTNVAFSTPGASAAVLNYYYMPIYKFA